VKLRDWLESKHMSPAEFADLIGCDRSSVGRWLDGTMPQRSARARIKEATGGAVTASDFLADEDEDEPQGRSGRGRGVLEGKAA